MRTVHKYRDYDFSAIVAAYKSGLGFKRLSQRFGVPTSVIRRHIKPLLTVRHTVIWNKGTVGNGRYRNWKNLADALIMADYVKEQNALMKFDEKHHWCVNALLRPMRNKRGCVSSHVSSRIRSRTWRLNNPDEHLSNTQLWRHLNPEKQKEITKRRSFNIYNSNEPRFIHAKIANRLRGRINAYVRRGMMTKSKSAISILSCTIQEFKEYIERQFTGSMSWENWGTM